MYMQIKVCACNVEGRIEGGYTRKQRRAARGAELMERALAKTLVCRARAWRERMVRAWSGTVGVKRTSMDKGKSEKEFGQISNADRAGGVCRGMVTLQMGQARGVNRAVKPQILTAECRI